MQNIRRVEKKRIDLECLFNILLVSLFNALSLGRCVRIHTRRSDLSPENSSKNGPSLGFESRMRSANGGRVRYLERTAHQSAIEAAGRTVRRRGHGCTNSPPFAGGSVTGGCISCSHAKASS